jgi:cytochrome c551/c552
LVDAGVSRESAMRQAGWSEEDIAAEAKAKEAEEARMLLRIKQAQVAALSDVTMEGGGKGPNEHVKIHY